MYKRQTTSLRRTAKRSSQRSAPASSATSGGWRARRRPGRKSPRPRPSTTMPGTTAGVTSSGRGASPATPTMGSPRAQPASPCWRSFAGKGWRMSAAWSPGTLAAVSYTHRDVYKETGRRRNGTCWTSPTWNTLPSVCSPTRRASPPTWPASGGRSTRRSWWTSTRTPTRSRTPSSRPCPRAVSYTHRDVYKRQT